MSDLQNYTIDQNNQSPQTSKPKNKVNTASIIIPNEKKAIIDKELLEKQKRIKEKEEMDEKQILDFLSKSNVMSKAPLNIQYESKEKLIEQNHRLKQTLAQLAQELDDLNQQEMERRPKAPKSEEFQSLQLKKIQLREQQQEIAKLEKHILNLDRLLEINYDRNQLEAKEDEVQLLRSENAALQEEKDAILGNPRKNTKAIEFMKNEAIYNLKLKSLQEKLQDQKLINNDLSQEVANAEQRLRQLNKNIQLKEERIKELETRIHEVQQFPERHFYVTEEELAVLEGRVSELEEQQKQLENIFAEKMAQLEQERKEKQKESELKLIALRELEKELKMNQFKFKELAKLIRHNVLPPIELNQSKSSSKAGKRLYKN